MALDGTLWVEDGVPYMIFAHEWIQITDGSMDLVQLAADLSAPVGAPRKLFHAFDEDGGHPMLFRAFDGRLLMAIHQPNRRVERAHFFEVDDSGDTVRVLREVTGGLRP